MSDETTDSGWTELARTADQGELAVLKSFLEGADIDYRVRGEEALHLYPVTVPGFFGSQGMAAVVDVRPQDLAEARQLLAAPPEPPEESIDDEG